MFQRLRKLLTSVPSITVVGILSAYLLLGFFALPAVLKWQLEKQLAERGHALRVGAVRFDPLRLQLEIDHLALADAQGGAMVGFDNLMVDLEWRSIIDGAWTIADARLLAPSVRIERAKDSDKHNFSDLLAQFAGAEPASTDKEDAAVPPLRVHRLLLSGGRIEWLDQMLEQPLVSRIVPLNISVFDLSTLADAPGRYQVSVRTEAGESLDLHGTVAVESRHATGELALRQLQVATLARGLNREIALQSPRGSLDLGGRFDVSIGSNGMPSGGASEVQLLLADLFVQAPGSGDTPLLAVQKLALNTGRLDLARRELEFDGLQIADASANAGIDAQGRGSWEAMLRVTQATPTETGAAAPPAAPASAMAPDNAAAPASTAAATGNTAPSHAEAPWTVSVGDVRVDRLALALRDAAQKRSVQVAALGLGTAVDAQLGGTAGNRIRLPQLRLTVDGLALEQTDAGVTVPSTQLDIGAITLQAKGDTVDATLGKVALVLAQGAATRNGARSASLGASDVTLAGIRARNGGGGARLDIDAPQIQARSLAAEAAGQTARIGQIGFGGSKLLLDTAGAGPNGGNGMTLSLDGPKVQIDALEASSGGAASPPATSQPTSQSAQLAQLTLQAQRLALALVDGENTVSLDALQSQVQKLQLLADGQSLSLASMALDNAQLKLQQGAGGAQMQAQAPSLQLTGIAARRGAERADLAELRLQGSRIDLGSGADSATELAFTGMQLAGKQLALARAADTVQLATMALGSEVLKLALGTDAARFSGSGTTAALTDVRATQAGNRVALQDARWKARSFEGSSALASGPARARARVDGSELSLATLGVGRGQTDTATAATNAAATGAKDLASLASATWSAGALTLDMADGPLQLRGDGMALQLGQAQLHDPSGANAQLVQLGDINLSGAVFSLADQSVTADTLQVRGVRASVWLDAQGRLNLLDVLGAPGPDAGAASKPAAVAAPAASSAPAAAPVAAAPAVPVGGKPWRVAVKTIDLQDAAARFEDRRREPALAMALEAVTLNLSGVDTAAGAPAMQVALGATLASGGTVQAKGSAALDPQAVDLQLAVTGLALAAVQPVLSDYLDLTLASGTASTQGRLTYGAVAGVPAQLTYTGGFAVDKFLLEEITPKRPFLAWETIRSDDLKLTLEPNRVDIGEVLLEQPVSRLIIAEDQSINITDVLKKRDGAAADVDKAPTPAAAGDDTPADPFPVTVARVKVNDGQLEFADLSLRPQFGTRMHQLKGVITGLGTDANRTAQVQLDARVDKFGSARIRGKLSLLQPERLTDISMAFRNLDMSAMSPYVVKFAGYEIASGRLTLDLQYKVADGKLQGENKLVLTKAELGKKVESPGALDLPLDLALAILKDADGVIDIGVPVRGDLNDPQFDYGAVIAKAIGNLIGGIITAPFRALAGMFGGGDKPIDTIAFEPGLATLAPPEQQKIETVAKALNARPNLSLKVAPVVAPEQDTPVLQSLIVRKELARRMGLELAPDEDPGPIDAANPRVPAAVEAAFAARYAPAVFDALKQRALEAAAPAAGASADAAAGAPATAASATPAAAPGTTAAAPAPAPAMPPVAFYQGLITRMIAEQAVSDEMLAQLATQRAEAIVQAVTGENGGVPVARVQTVAQRTITNATEGVVPLKLELDVVK